MSSLDEQKYAVNVVMAACNAAAQAEALSESAIVKFILLIDCGPYWHPALRHLACTTVST